MKSVVTFSFLLTLLSLMAFQSKPKGYVIKGMIEGAPKDAWVYMTGEFDSPMHYYDSVKLKNGRFVFKGEVDGPELRYITYFKNPSQRVSGWKDIIMIPFYIENSEIRFSIPFEELPSKLVLEIPRNLRIEGSRSHDLYAAYQKQVNPLILKDDSLFWAYGRAYYHNKGTKEDAVRCVRGMKAMQDSIHKIGVEFIRRNPESPVALYVAQNLGVRAYGREEAKRIATFFPESVKTTPQGQETMKALLERPVYVGDVLPDFEVLNTDLQAMKLSELVKKGHYTLVEFWASWCGPCRADIPHLKETYEQYREDEFDIISVSIDDDRAAWKDAVEKEKMKWTQVCGAKGKKFDKECVKLFGFNGIPSCVLVDKEGRIYSLSSRGGWLNMHLENIYKH
ncbi:MULTISPECIES: TlpA disulfide reductase family protein [unclassified Butyricimonas]|uniref:TlpA disulfide reductase family protein n=1 Tax=unclassified Butyricimonas TaxID=2637652 RepID=UPI000C0757A9|nr:MULTISPECIES: TlpA disulfide reductase family protein [unclassified Butyricimonas]